MKTLEVVIEVSPDGVWVKYKPQHVRLIVRFPKTGREQVYDAQDHISFRDALK